MNGKSKAERPPLWQREFLTEHRLDPSYLQHAQLWFEPLAAMLASHQNGAPGTLLVGVNGCQGSGKTTLCDYLGAALNADYGLRALALSLDDFYLTRDQRHRLGADVHPLLATRGVPGTHDMGLLKRTLDALLSATAGEPTPALIPRFDKAVDDRHPQSGWERVDGAVDVVLLEGWCLGARPQQAAELAQPVNELERNEDPDGSWRGQVNAALEEDFLPLYERMDYWVMLHAPSFECVYRWRLEQEQKLASSSSGGGVGIMNEAQVARFIQFYQRLTENCLALLPERVNYLYSLDSQRRITASHQRESRSS